MEINSNIVWNEKAYKELVKYLESLAEEKYRDFNSKIVSTEYKMLGIRLPIIRKLAKKISKTNFEDLLSLFNDEYYEVILLEGLIISYVKDYEETVSRLKSYVKKIDNWAICDTVISSLKIINLNKDKALNLISEFISDEHEFTVRCGFVILLDFYVDEDYLDFIFKCVSQIKRDDYYINMAISWLLCECYTKFSDKTYVFIKEANLSEFIIRKTSSKVNDSYRVSIENKDKLKRLKDKILN